MAKMVYESDNIQALADKMRELTGTSTQYTTYDFADGVEQVYNVGYEKGYADGKSQGGGGGGNSDTYGVDYMLTVLPFLNKVEWTTTANSYDEHFEDPFSRSGYSGLITLAFGGDITLAIIPPWITEVQDEAMEYIQSYVIFTSKTPPVIGVQGMWAEWGGCQPPIAIFVPNEAIEDYCNETNLAEFAHLIKPLSEYNGEGYYGGKL